MFVRETIERFYDGYGLREWERLEQDAYHRLIFTLHADFLRAGIAPGRRVLDAGCGGGRFSLLCAAQGCRVTLLDLSQTQLDIARRQCEKSGVAGQLDGSFHLSVTDMSAIPDNSFDTVVCYGAVLNYLHEEAPKAVSELTRVTRDGGMLYVSVNNKDGVLRSCAAKLKMPLCDFWGKPEVWGIYQVLETGDEPAYPGASQPPRHYFTSAELHGLLTRSELTQLTLAAAPAVLTGLRDQAETLARDPKAWKVIEDMERSQYQNPAITDCGEFLLARARVQKGETHHE